MNAYDVLHNLDLSQEIDEEYFEQLKKTFGPARLSVSLNRDNEKLFERKSLAERHLQSRNPAQYAFREIIFSAIADDIILNWPLYVIQRSKQILPNPQILHQRQHRIINLSKHQ
jgi:hypothetical protein